MKLQRGATLIVALVLLAVVTLLGAAGIRGTSLEMKMIASARDRAIAFEAAEATLRNVEKNLIDRTPTIEEISTQFTETCSGEGFAGQCFGGSFDITDPYRTCTLFREGETDFTQFWERENNFVSDDQLAKINAAVEGNQNKQIDTQYLVEFMCFTLKERGLKGTIDDKETGDEDLIYMPLYRITAVAEGLGGRATVMAQAMVKVGVE